MSDERTLIKFETYMYGIKGNKEGLIKIPQEYYELTTERLRITKQGMITETRNAIELFKIKNITVYQKMKDKLMDVGDIEIISADESNPKIILKRIKNPHDIREKIRDAAKKARAAAGVTYRFDL